VHVEIWSDIVCPWCAIGKRRFEKALAQFEHRDAVKVSWRSFELNPGAERGYDGTLNEWLARHKGIGIQQAAAMNDNVAALAAKEGLTFNLDQARPANTFDAHRLTHFAELLGKRGEMTERLFRAYFEEGEAVDDAGTLAKLAGEAGLDQEEAAKILQGEDFVQAVRAEEEKAVRMGIHGVPFFLIEGKYGISGAQGPERFSLGLRQIWAQTGAGKMGG
jgi:predicted DsbA family dithiol-disulfide isomerase